MFLECSLSFKAWLNAVELNVFDAIQRQIEASGLFARLQTWINHHFLACKWRVFPPVVSMWFLFSACGALVSVSFVYYYSTKPEWWFPHCLLRQWRIQRVGEGTALLTVFQSSLLPYKTVPWIIKVQLLKVATICDELAVIMWRTKSYVFKHMAFMAVFAKSLPQRVFESVVHV